MINPIAIYSECGTKAGTAQRQHDSARARFESNWFRIAMQRENEEDQKAAELAFNAAYREAMQVGIHSFS